MGGEMDMMQRLAASKKIMEKTEQIKRGDVRMTSPEVQAFEPTNAVYNLPENLVSESTTTNTYDPKTPLDQDRIMNSKLPDEIKRLMIEQPIIQHNGMVGSTSISEEVIQGAQRLMNMGKNNNSDSQTKNVPTNTNTTTNTNTATPTNINMNEIKSMIRDVVRDTVRDVIREELKESGMLVESTTNANETIQFKVGNTLFVGKVLKIKTLEK